MFIVRNLKPSVARRRTAARLKKVARLRLSSKKNSSKKTCFGRREFHEHIKVIFNLICNVLKYFKLVYRSILASFSN